MRGPRVGHGPELSQWQHRDGELGDQAGCLPGAERLGAGGRGPLIAHQAGQRLASVRRRVTGREDPDVVAHVPQVLAALQLDQHVRELIGAAER